MLEITKEINPDEIKDKIGTKLYALEDIACKLKTSPIGTRIIYHEGCLPVNLFPPPFNEWQSKLSAVRRFAYERYNEGEVFLCQHRVDDFKYIYLMVKVDQRYWGPKRLEERRQSNYRLDNPTPHQKPFVHYNKRVIHLAPKNVFQNS